MSHETRIDQGPTRHGFLTNYPPFRYWRGTAVDEIRKPKPLNIYLHTPYCIQRCSYCHYKTTTLGENRQPEIDGYVSALCREIEIASRHFHLKDRPTTSLYFGGGTPTLLSDDNLKRIMDALNENLTLDEPEIIFEAEPVTLTERKAAFLETIGVNRISLGIQSFADSVVWRTGRKDTEEQALRAIEIAKSTGSIINIDLLSGLAGEQQDTWAYSVDRALDVDVHCITLYKMELYANTEYHAGVQADTLALPSDSEEIAFARYARDRFVDAGYLPVTSFTFGKEGKYAQRHIASKWRGDDNYAAGVSAFGSVGNASYQNTSDLAEYLSRVEAGELPMYRGLVLSSVDLMVRDVALGMKLIDIDRRTFEQRHGVDLVAACGSTLAELEHMGFLQTTDTKISLAPEGILFGDYVATALAESLRDFMTKRTEHPALIEPELETRTESASA